MQIWEISRPYEDLIKNLSLETDLSESLVRLFVARGLDSKQKILDLTESRSLRNPYDIIDMEKAVDRIELALDRNEKICIYGDYDADGVTATALLLNWFKEKGADVFFYIPDRRSEGYGLNENAVRSIADKSVDLIITVDNGISAVNEARLIKELRMELVVTDHHRVGDEIPDCCAVVDPHRSECKIAFKDWCGVGIAFKLICALEDKSLKLKKVLSDIPGGLRRGFGDSKEGVEKLIEGDVSLRLLEEYSDIVSVGTIGDVVPLTDENRVIVKAGLEKISSQNGLNPGIAALIEKAGVRFPLNSNSIAFSVVPKLNAVGRLSSAAEAVELLTAKSRSAADIIADKIISYNENRQSFGDEIEKDIENIIHKDPSCLNERVLIFAGRNWHDGLIGIVAARYAERFGKPCLVITYDDKNAKGSGRSIEGFSLFECIYSCSPLLTHFGGHPMAAGFSLLTENLEQFKNSVREYAKSVEMPFQRIKIDCELKTPDVPDPCYLIPVT